MHEPRVQRGFADWCREGNIGRKRCGRPDHVHARLREKGGQWQSVAFHQTRVSNPNSKHESGPGRQLRRCHIAWSMWSISNFVCTKDPQKALAYARTLAPKIVVFDHSPGSEWAFYAAEEGKVRCGTFSLAATSRPTSSSEYSSKNGPGPPRRGNQAASRYAPDQFVGSQSRGPLRLRQRPPGHMHRRVRTKRRALLGR